jgi:hypothetical protein
MADAPARRGFLPCDSPLKGETLDLGPIEWNRIKVYLFTLVHDLSETGFHPSGQARGHALRNHALAHGGARGRVDPSHPIGHFLGDLGPGLLGIAVQIIPRQNVL